MANKPIGEIVGDLIAVLVRKKILNADELKEVIGKDYYEELAVEIAKEMKKE